MIKKIDGKVNVQPAILPFFLEVFLERNSVRHRPKNYI